MSRYLKKTSLPLTLIALLAAALLTLRGEAQQPQKQTPTLANGERMIANGDKPVSAVAVAFAESDAVRDMPDADVVNASSDRLGDNEGEEKNPDNVAIANFKRAQISAYRAAHPELKYLPSSMDSAIRSNPPSPSLPAAPIVSFDGMTANDGITTTGSIVAPSDENIGVGPKHVVQTTNTGFRIYDKAGNPLVAPKAIKSLFSKLGGVCATFERGDPIVMHDRLADRWVISQFDFANAKAAPFFECIAVSKTSDPTGSYYTYAFQTPTETPPNPTPGPGQNFPDYPHLGTW